MATGLKKRTDAESSEYRARTNAEGERMRLSTLRFLAIAATALMVMAELYLIFCFIGGKP